MESTLCSGSPIEELDRLVAGGLPADGNNAEGIIGGGLEARADTTGMGGGLKHRGRFSKERSRWRTGIWTSSGTCQGAPPRTGAVPGGPPAATSAANGRTGR
uniref:Uncharacterized protein n=1 Tax=Zooxanthella nutricula TaxID=1333877 RepID=A0A7S2NXZ7_9DINO